MESYPVSLGVSPPRPLGAHARDMFRVSDVGPAQWIDLARGLASETLNIIGNF